jgi:hypothetical protein
LIGSPAMRVAASASTVPYRKGELGRSCRWWQAKAARSNTKRRPRPGRARERSSRQGRALALSCYPWILVSSPTPPPRGTRGRAVVGVVGVVGVPVRRASTKQAQRCGWGMGDHGWQDDQSIQTLRPSPSCTDARLPEDGTERYSTAQDSIKNRECEHSLVLHAIAACYIATARTSQG